MMKFYELGVHDILMKQAIMNPESNDFDLISGRNQQNSAPKFGQNEEQFDF